MIGRSQQKYDGTHALAAAVRKGTRPHRAVRVDDGADLVPDRRERVPVVGAQRLAERVQSGHVTAGQTVGARVEALPAAQWARSARNDSSGVDSTASIPASTAHEPAVGVRKSGE
jgi:hypothetical protein